MFKIKVNKTRISFWIDNIGRVSKIETNRFIITNGLNNSYRHLWNIIEFENINTAIILLQNYLSNQHIYLSLDDKIHIFNSYSHI